MDVMELLKSIVARMDTLYTEYGYDEQKALENAEYELLKRVSDNLSQGIRKVAGARIINNSYMCIHDSQESEDIMDYVDMSLIEQMKQLGSIF